jgi:hypothetical protein
MTQNHLPIIPGRGKIGDGGQTEKKKGDRKEAK